MYGTVVQRIAHRVERQKICARVRHSDVSGLSGYNAGMVRSTGCEPNVGQDESGTLSFFDCGPRHSNEQRMNECQDSMRMFLVRSIASWRR